MVRYSTVQYVTVRHSFYTEWYSTIWYGMFRCGTVCYDIFCCESWSCPPGHLPWVLRPLMGVFKLLSKHIDNTLYSINSFTSDSRHIDLSQLALVGSSRVRPGLMGPGSLRWNPVHSGPVRSSPVGIYFVSVRWGQVRSGPVRSWLGVLWALNPTRAT